MATALGTMVDPITLEVIRGSLVSTVLQMRATLVRTAYAPIIYEVSDAGQDGGTRSGISLAG